MCKVTVEELISTLDTFDAEHCISIGKDPRTEEMCLEVWDNATGSTINLIKLPESILLHTDNGF